MRLILLLLLISSLGACTVPRALSLKAALHEPGILPPGIQRTHTGIDPVVFQWEAGKDPGIYVEADWHGELSDLIAWYDQHLPSQGWRITWKPEDPPDGVVNRMQRDFERTGPLVKEVLSLDAYRKPDAPGVCMLKITLDRESKLDKPSQTIGVGLTLVCFGWMGEYAIFFQPVEVALEYIF